MLLKRKKKKQKWEIEREGVWYSGIGESVNNEFVVGLFCLMGLVNGMERHRFIIVCVIIMRKMRI